MKYQYTKVEKVVIWAIFSVFLVAMLNYSFQIYSGEIPFPEECSGRGHWICDFGNLIFAQNGYAGVAMFHLALTVLVFVIVYVITAEENKAVPEMNQNQTIKMQRVATKPQTINNVLVEGEEPTDEFLEEFSALRNAEPLSDDELAKQALSYKKSES